MRVRQINNNGSDICDVCRKGPKVMIIILCEGEGQTLCPHCAIELRDGLVAALPHRGLHVSSEER